MFDLQNYEEQVFIKKKMYKYKSEAFKLLSAIVHPNYLENMAISFAYSYDQENIDADIIARRLGLNQLHILAILDREEDFARAYYIYHEESAYIGV